MQNVYDSNGIRKVNSFSSLNSDTAVFDAFGRLRVSSPVTIFDSKLSYNTGSLIWDTVLTAGGTAVHRQNESSVRMTVAANGDSVVRQSRQYLPYRPGKSLLAACTFVLGEQVDNARSRIGFFDANNGIYFEQDASGDLYIVRRTYTSGSVVNNAVAQSAWNIDTFQGTGPSQKTLVPAKAQILLIDLQWLGVGRVRVGFDIDGVFYPAHEFLNANSLSLVYMTTATLPVRYEITATGVIAKSSYMDQICSAVVSEGGLEADLGFPRAIGNGTTKISVTTRRPILSIQPKATYGGITNRMYLLLEQYQAYVETTQAIMEVVYNGSLTGAAFGSAGTNSAMNYDVSATAITGGDVIAYAFIPAGATIEGIFAGTVANRLPLTLDTAGANPISISLVMTRNNGAGTCNCQGSFQWREVQ